MEKSAQNLVAAIEKSKERPLGAVINALGIGNIGEKTVTCGKCGATFKKKA